MHISVWSHDSNPSIDRRSYRRSRHYCATEVAEGRAYQVDADDLARGIHLFAPDDIVRKAKTEHRGSPQSHGCLTASESHLNSQYQRNTSKVDQAVFEGRACFVPGVVIPQLAWDYETHLSRHEAQGRKGTPRACAVIAARVKTILSDPALAPERVSA